MRTFDVLNAVVSTWRGGARRLAEPQALFPAVGIVLLAVVWGSTINLIRVERDAAERTAASSSRELAETYEAQVVRALREIDQTLKFVKYAYESTGGHIDIARLQARSLLLPPLVFTLAVADREGRIVAATRSPEMADVGREDFFVAQREADRIVVGRPRYSPAAREWKLDFSRRLDGPDGSFAGTVIVSVSSGYFVSGYEPARFGQAGALGLLGTDGVFRALRSGDAVRSGDVTDYRAVVPAGVEEPAPALVVNRWDGVRRYTSARELYEFPLAVVAGLSADEQLGAAGRQARVYLWRAAGASAILIAILAGLGRLSWQLARTRAESHRALQEEIAIRRIAEAALNLRNRAIESSVNAILILDSAGGHAIEYANPAFEQITGYSTSEAMGRDIGFLLGDEGDQTGMQEIRKALRELRDAHAVLRNYRKDGRPFWNEFSLAPVRNESGQVAHFVAVMNDVTEAKTYEQQLAHQANFDTLTGLANRNLLQDRLHQAIANAKRQAGALAVVFLDVDHFKIVNDSLGHNFGDELLRKIAARLRASVRESDTVARLGGDEFVLVLSNPALGARREGEAPEPYITALMEKLLATVAGPIMLGGRQMRVSCSMGVSLYPQDGEDSNTLLKNADAAMYRAKELGRNRFQFFTAEVHERIRRRMELEASLRSALEGDEFELRFQPQVEVATGRIVGAETLLRWKHPTQGLVGPAQFIGFAEETGLIVPIGAWVLRAACAQGKAWRAAGLPAVPLAVNMSARQCEQQDIDAVVRAAISEAALEPGGLQLEITESISMANPDQSVPLMERLKSTGVSISIDDFGTGFSNLSYLKRFPVDELKVDISFVREIATDSESLAIVQAIITLAHSLGLRVVAEGVESEAQLALLRSHGCDVVQGYLFGAPMPAEQFADLLRRNRAAESRSAETVTAESGGP